MEHGQGMVTGRVWNGTWTGYGNREGVEWNMDRVWQQGGCGMEHGQGMVTGRVWNGHGQGMVTGRVWNGTLAGYGNREGVEWNMDRVW